MPVGSSWLTQIQKFRRNYRLSLNSATVIMHLPLRSLMCPDNYPLTSDPSFNFSVSGKLVFFHHLHVLTLMDQTNGLPSAFGETQNGKTKPGICFGVNQSRPLTSARATKPLLINSDLHTKFTCATNTKRSGSISWADSTTNL